MTYYHAQAHDHDKPYPMCGRADFDRDDLYKPKKFARKLESAKRGYWSTHGDVAMISSLGYCWECASILGVDNMNIDWSKDG